MPQPEATLSSGSVDLKGHIIQRQTTQNITSSLALADLTGKFGKNNFHGFSTTMDLDIGKTPQEIQIRRVSGSLSEGGNAGGNFSLSGTHNIANSSSQLTAKFINFNQ